MYDLFFRVYTVTATGTDITTIAVSRPNDLKPFKHFNSLVSQTQKFSKCVSYLVKVFQHILMQVQLLCIFSRYSYELSE